MIVPFFVDMRVAVIAGQRMARLLAMQPPRRRVKCGQCIARCGSANLLFGARAQARSIRGGQLRPGTMWAAGARRRRP